MRFTWVIEIFVHLILTSYTHYPSLICFHCQILLSERKKNGFNVLNLKQPHSKRTLKRRVNAPSQTNQAVKIAVNSSWAFFFCLDRICVIFSSVCQWDQQGVRLSLFKDDVSVKFVFWRRRLLYLDLMRCQTWNFCPNYFSEMGYKCKKIRNCNVK